jgi:hypothetical protein
MPVGLVGEQAARRMVAGHNLPTDQRVARLIDAGDCGARYPGPSKLPSEVILVSDSGVALSLVKGKSDTSSIMCSDEEI